MDKQVITDWFDANKSGGLILPDGWWLKPYDNFYRLTFIEVRPIKTILELEGKSLLIFTSLTSASVEPDTGQLLLSDFVQLVFDYEDPRFARDAKPALKSYLDGIVRFVPVSALLQNGTTV